MQLENPYILLTPGPLSTSENVRKAMLQDWCTWDDEYNHGVVEDIRKGLLDLAKVSDAYSTVLLQGSGTYAVEAILGSAVHSDEKILVIANGAYGERAGKICSVLKLDHQLISLKETETMDLTVLEGILEKSSFSHIIMVHCETTTGILNPIEEVATLAKKYKAKFIVDAMSSFGGIPIEIEHKIDCIISSANKCIQGVPGFGFAIATKEFINSCKGNAKSLSLDVYDQWKAMEDGKGKWRFTSPTHVVRAFQVALHELQEETLGNRYKRYSENQETLRRGMSVLGFDTVVENKLQSPIITSFKFPQNPLFNFKQFYNLLKNQGFVIYPGKVSNCPSFRIGTIGHVFPKDISRLLVAVEKCCYWKTELSNYGN